MAAWTRGTLLAPQPVAWPMAIRSSRISGFVSCAGKSASAVSIRDGAITS